MIIIPIQACSINGSNGFQWGDGGKCYPHDGSDEGISKAKEKAYLQGLAEGGGKITEITLNAEQLTPEYLRAFYDLVVAHPAIYKHIIAEIHTTARASAGGKLHGKGEKLPDGSAFFVADVKTNSSQMGGKLIEATDSQTIIPVVLMRERVTNGALKKYEEFAPHAHWFEGVPIIPPHHAGDPPVSHLTQKAGKIRNVKLNADLKRVEAEAILFNDRIAPGDLERIKNGEPFGGSIGYYCNEEKLESPLKWEDGTEYKTIERGPFFADHFSMVPVGACPLPECGFNVNASEIKEPDNMTDPIVPAVDPLKANVAIDPVVPAVAPQVNVENKIDLSAVLTKIDALSGVVAELKANTAAKDEEIKALKEAESLRQNAINEQADQAAKAGFAAILNANAKAALDTLYTEYVKSPALWIVTNADKIDLAPKATVTPLGQPFVPHVNAEEDEELKGMMPTDEQAGMRKVA